MPRVITKTVSNVIVKTNDFTVPSGEGYFINTTSQTNRLHRCPITRAKLRLLIMWTLNTNNITVDRNGNLFNGANQNITVDTARAAFKRYLLMVHKVDAN